MVNIFALTAIALSSAVSASAPVQWQADYGKALAATRSDDRPLLVVLDVPAKPKKAVDEELLEADGEQAKLLAPYQLCHIDASTEYGQKVAKVFKADKFPFTAIIDKTGKVVLHKQVGQLTESEWNETLVEYQAGERAQPVSYTTAYRGNVIETPSSSFNTSYPSVMPATMSPATPSIVSPSYCPSCQKNAQRGF